MAKIKRGPKPKTAANTRRQSGAGIWTDVAPSELDDASSLEFDRLVKILELAGTLDRTDVSVVVTAARLKALLDRAFDELTRDGMTVTTETSSGDMNLKAHPMLSVINSMTQRYRVILNDLGLTPVSSKLTNPLQSGAVENSDPISEFLNVVG